MSCPCVIRKRLLAAVIPATMLAPGLSHYCVYLASRWNSPRAQLSTLPSHSPRRLNGVVTVSRAGLAARRRYSASTLLAVPEVVQIRAVLLPGDNCRSTTILIANAARGRNASVKDRALETWFSRGFWAPKHAIRSSPGQTRRRRSDQVLPHLRAISHLTASGQQEQAVATGEV